MWKFTSCNSHCGLTLILTLNLFGLWFNSWSVNLSHFPQDYCIWTSAHLRAGFGLVSPSQSHILACLSYASVEDPIKGKVAWSWKVARGLISYMLTHVWFVWMNTCPAQQIMKHCHHDSAQQGLLLIYYSACLGDPTVELGTIMVMMQ